MPRYRTLVSLLDDLRAECTFSLNPAHNNQSRDRQVNSLQRMQEWLWGDFDWPHLRVIRYVKPEAGQRFYDTPEDLDIDRIEKIEFRYGGRWVTLHYGIEQMHYRQFDSENGVRAYPIRRWRFYEGEQMELWPIPDIDGDEATYDGMLKITGIKKLAPLVDDTDRAELDSRLITMFAAADILSDEKKAAKKLNQANKLYSSIKRHLMPRRKNKMFGVAEDDKGLLRGPPPVYYRTTS